MSTSATGCSAVIRVRLVMPPSYRIVLRHLAARVKVDTCSPLFSATPSGSSGVSGVGRFVDGEVDQDQYDLAMSHGSSATRSRPARWPAHRWSRPRRR
jgi:hypothetical protein